jgi:hypothetical protein
MGAHKKFKQRYLAEEQQPSDKEDKKLIHAYLEKIAKLLEDQNKQKKAAQIISQMINSKK